MDEIAARKTCWVAAIHSVEGARPLLPARLPEATNGRLVEQFDRLAAEHRELSEFNSNPVIPNWIPWVIPAVALIFGLGTNVFSKSGQINLISFPVFSLLAWNILIYALLIVGAAKPASGLWKPLQAWLARGSDSLHGTGESAVSGVIPWLMIRKEFFRRWIPQSQALISERIKVNLHLAAIMAALGVVLGMYLRGLAFEYRAGWSSTFLNGESLEQFLRFTLGTAAWVSGIELPNADRLAQLSWSQGSKGENAATWIHLYAVTCLLFIGLPRLLLALGSAGKAGRLQAEFPLDVNALGLTPAPDMALEDRSNPKAKQICVIPFNLELKPKDRELIRLFAFGEAGGPVNIDYREKIDYSEIENYFAAFTPAAPEAHRTVLMFNLSATPEHEVQGDAIKLLQEKVPGERLLVYLDGDAFTKRFGGDPDFSNRLTKRKESWVNFLKTYALNPLFMRADA